MSLLQNWQTAGRDTLKLTNACGTCTTRAIVLNLAGNFSKAADDGTVVLTARRGMLLPPNGRGDVGGGGFCNIAAHGRFSRRTRLTTTLHY